MDIDIYGISNCDTIKKARTWLAVQGVAHTFHDYGKEGVDRELLVRWCDAAGWEALLNRRGTTWRRLPEGEREGVDRERALALMMAHPSLIKRPVLMVGNTIELGFSGDRYRELCA
ncbi:MAG TPA: ArsC family reductase [Mariprofundaceae bacterium]|nr:ArsC family reductase [Mariprofundaceae bacterium]